jgi:hypothetical protein
MQGERPMKRMEGKGRFECSLGRGRVNRGEFTIKLEISQDGQISGIICEEKETELKWYHAIPFLRHVFLFLITPRISNNPNSSIKGKMGIDTLVFGKEYDGAQTPGYIRYELTKKGSAFKGTFSAWAYDYSDFDYAYVGSGTATIEFV